MNSIIHRAISAWCLWRAERRFYRANPQMKARAEAIRAARKSHKPVKSIMAAQKQDMLRMLREGGR